MTQEAGQQCTRCRHFLCLCLQGVQAACIEMEGCAGAVVLPLDICSPASQLHEAAVEADNAFSGEGVDYLVHNAGMLQVLSVFQVPDQREADSCLLARYKCAALLGLLHPGLLMVQLWEKTCAAWQVLANPSRVS